MTGVDWSRAAKGYTPAASVPYVYGRTRTIESITIHHWGVPGQSHDGVVSFFADGPGTTSAHFVVSAGRVNCLVSPVDAAWHAGNATGNATSIGIECRPEATDGDYATTAELIRSLRAQYGDLPLIPHRHWQATACPGVWDLNRLDSLASGSAAIGAAGTITPEAPEGLFMALTEQQQKDIYWQTCTEEGRNAAADRVVDRLLSRRLPLVDPTGLTKDVTGTTTLETKASWAAYLHAETLAAIAKQG